MAKLIDRTGQTFGELKVTSRAENARRGDAQWLCDCSCGKTGVVVLASSLVSGKTKSCGHLGGVIDRTGQTFGELKVTARAENAKSGDAQWLCDCSCGKTGVVVLARSLVSGDTKSCGHLGAVDPESMALALDLVRQGMTQAEAAEMLDVSLDSVRRAVARARKSNPTMEEKAS